MWASFGSCSGVGTSAAVERHRHGEYRLAVLDRDDAAGGETLAVADAIDLIDDRHLGISRQQEISVQGVRRPAGNVGGAAGRNQRLPDHLSAEHALPAHLRRASAEQVLLEPLEV